MTKKDKKDLMEPEFDEHGDQTVKSMMYGHIDPTYLNRLLLEHKDNVAKYAVRDAKGKIIKNAPIGEKLGKVIQIIIKKTAGDERWRKYTDNWREEMFARAELVCLHYIHNYDPAKLEQSKNHDPYYYVANCVTFAFMQEKAILKKKHEAIKFIPLNEGIYHGCVSMDQYAGVLKAEEARRKKEKANDACQGFTPMADRLDTLDALDKDGVDQNQLALDDEARHAKERKAKKKELSAK